MKKKTTFSIDENIMSLFIRATSEVSVSRSSIIENMIRERIRMLVKQKEISIKDLFTNWQGQIFADDMSMSEIIDAKKVHNWVGFVGEYEKLPDPIEKISFTLSSGEVRVFHFSNEYERNEKVQILDI